MLSAVAIRLIPALAVLACVLGTVSASFVVRSADLDPGFNPGSGFNGDVYSLAVDSQGRIIVGGDFTEANKIPRRNIARLNADGGVDTTFQVGSGASNVVLTVATQADGKVLLGGDFTGINGTAINRIARLNANGTLDTGFAVGSGLDDAPTGVAVQADGKIVVGGYFGRVNGATNWHLTRLNSDGSRDPAFTPGTGPNGYVTSLALQSDGKILIGGEFTSFNRVRRTRIARLLSDGTLDASFSPGGGASAEVFAIAQQLDGRILLGGAFTEINEEAREYLARLNADGSLDPDFNPGATLDVLAVAAQANGKPLVGGVFDAIANGTDGYFVRLTTDGKLDRSLSATPDDAVNTIIVQPDGNIVIGGAFGTINNTKISRIARLVGDPVTATAPRITAPTRQGTIFTVQVQTISGKAYSLEYKATVAPSDWTALLAVPGDGTVKLLTDPAATPAMRFYRVRMD